MQFLNQTSHVREGGLIFPGWQSIVAYFSIEFYRNQWANIGNVIRLAYRHELFARLQD